MRVHARRTKVLTILVAFAALGQMPRGYAQSPPPNFDPVGFQPKRGYHSQFPFDRVDMINGNLTLAFTDMVLPGNAGMDIRITRSCSRQSSCWTFSFADVPVRMANPIKHPPHPNGEVPDWNPQLFMGDFSAHELYGTWESGVLHTVEFWKWNIAARTLELPNGWVATYEQQGDPAGGIMLLEVHDQFGNSITPHWIGGAPEDIRPLPLDAITQTVGNPGSPTLSRYVDFTYEPGSLLPSTIQFDGQVWTYHWGEHGLTSVQPPAGPAWQYSYVPGLDGAMTVTLPAGGTVTYDFDSQEIPVFDPPRSVVRSITTGGHEISSGTWTFSYGATPTTQGIGTVTLPSGRYLRYEHTWGGFNLNGTWLLTGKQLKEGDTVVASFARQFQDLPVPFSTSPGWPQPAGEQIVQDGVTFSTTYEYGTSNFADYHRPDTITETASNNPLSRVTTRTFDYAFGPYILDRVKSVTATVDGKSFTTDSEYQNETGFMIEQTVNGTLSSFTHDGFGNVREVKDARLNITASAYKWGVTSAITTPVYFLGHISREINSDGTVAWEETDGKRTSYSYDGLGRLIGTSPPCGTPPCSLGTSTTYDPAGRFITVTRGSTSTTTHLDGFGRPVRSEDSAGTETKTRYDAEGRREYQSYPFSGTVLERGDDFEYDALGRVRKVIHTGGSYVETTYTADAVRIRDEEGRITEQRWRAFGDPSDARLMSVLDANLKEWNYKYTALGALREVDPPDVTEPAGSPPNRIWNYADGTHRLGSDVQPESGTTNYQYDPVGNLTQKTDALDRIIVYGYDGNNRLTSIDAPGTADDVTLIQYDPFDNRKRVTTPLVDSEFFYDDASRLIRRKDTISGRVFETKYEYDGLDILTTIDYPGGRRVSYAVDATAGRVVGVSGQGGLNYATDITYHPSGAISGLKFGNSAPGNVVQESRTFDDRQRPLNLTSGPASGSLNLTYGYDNVGNVTGITDVRGGGFSSGFTYDPLDRLRFVTGFGAREYRYDELGNRTKKIVGGSEITYAYTLGNQRLTGITGSPETATLTYNAVGNLENDGVGSYLYSPFNLMASSTVNSVTTSYGYDGDNQRKRKQGPDGVRYYIHGPGGQLLAEYRETPSGPELVREYVYLGSKLIASSTRVDPPVPTGRVTGVSASPLAQKFGTSVTITVTGWTTPCSQVRVNFGDNTETTYPIASPYQLPLQVTHTYAAAGLYKVVATGQTGASGPCVGQVSMPLEVTSGNVVTNGTFSQVDGAGNPVNWSIFYVGDPPHWTLPQPSGSGITFHRHGASLQAVVLQYTGLPLGAPGAPLELTFTMGNTDTIRKRLVVLVHNSTSDDSTACSFWLDASQPSDKAYTMRMHTTKPWTNASVSFYAAEANDPSTHGDYHLNNVTLTYRPAGNTAKTECVDPMMPGLTLETEGHSLANILLDGGFNYPGPPQTQDGPYWTISGGMARQWTTAMVEFHRVPGLPLGEPQHIWQASTQGSAAGQRFQATFELGNSSATRQKVNVIWHGGDGTGMTLCTFWLPPGQAKQPYAMTGFSKTAWPNATFIVEPTTAAAQGSGTHEWLELDNVDFRKTNRPMPGTECWEPGSFTVDTTGFINAEWPAAPAPMPEPEAEAEGAGSGVPGFRSAGVRHPVPGFRGSDMPRQEEAALAAPWFVMEAGSSAFADASADSPESWRLRLDPAGPLDGLTFPADNADVSGSAIAPEPARTDPLTITIGGTSSGTVTSSPGGITCAGSTVSCTGWFPEGAPVTLTATPDTGMVFVGWAGVCTGTGTCQVTVNGPKTVVAHFASPLQYYHLDVLGSVRMVTDAMGAVVKRHDYFAFGEDTAPLTGDPRRFTGKELDSETALHYFGARYHRNLTGRLTTVDPVLDQATAVFNPQGWNRYAYVRNNPLKYIDPDGRDPRQVFGAAAAATAAWPPAGVVVLTGAAVYGVYTAWENREVIIDTVVTGVASLTDGLFRTSASEYGEKLGRFRDALDPDTVRDAARNARGEFLTWPKGHKKAGQPIRHDQKVKEALSGIRNAIQDVMKQLAKDKLTAEERAALEKVLKEYIALRNDTINLLAGGG